MTAKATKLGLFGQAIETLHTAALYERKMFLVGQIGEVRDLIRIDTEILDSTIHKDETSAPFRAQTARAIARRCEALAYLEDCLSTPLLAFNRNMHHHRVVYLEADGKTLNTSEVRRDYVPETLRLRHIWEALDVTMKRRAAEEYRERVEDKAFKVLGLGLENGQLMFVYSNWSAENHELCIYRLPVREDDLPELPMAAEA
jgi:hypothetical protein